MLDTDVDGYHGALAQIEDGAGSAVRRAEGPKRDARCSACDATTFDSVRACFWYGGAAFDLAEDEPGLALEDFFQSYLLTARCTACRKSSELAGFDL